MEEMNKLKTQIESLNKTINSLMIDQLWKNVKSKILSLNSRYFDSFDESFVVEDDNYNSIRISFDTQEAKICLEVQDFLIHLVEDYIINHPTISYSDWEFDEWYGLSCIENNIKFNQYEKEQLIRIIKEKWIDFTNWFKNSKIPIILIEELPIKEIKLSFGGLKTILIATQTDPNKMKIYNKVKLLFDKQNQLSKLKELEFMGKLGGVLKDFNI